MLVAAPEPVVAVADFSAVVEPVMVVDIEDEIGWLGLMAFQHFLPEMIRPDKSTEES